MITGTKHIWDYDTKSIDLKNPRVLLWHLSRQVNTGQWQEIDKRLLEENLEKLDIDPTQKLMLRRYYADKRTKKSS